MAIISSIVTSPRLLERKLAERKSNDRMKLNAKILKEKYYDEYNKVYFNGVLKHCNISYCKISLVGQYTHKIDKKGDIVGRIWIANDVDWTEETLKDTLIHEMIHHYEVSIDKRTSIDSFTWYGLFGHGRHFRKQIKRIKRDFGIAIHIHFPHIFKRKEKIPTTWFGKLLRFLDYEIT